MRFLLGIILTADVFGASPPTKDQAYQLNRASKLNADAQVGTALRNAGQFGVKATWDKSVLGGSGDLYLVDEENKQVKLPSGAVIRDCLIDVVTQPTSSGNSGKISLGVSALGDLKADALVHTTYTTSARIVCLPVGTVGTMIKLSSEGRVIMRIGSEPLTAGKINVWLEYVLSE